MYVHLGNLGIHDQWSVLLSDPSAKKKTSLFFREDTYQLQVAGINFSKQTMPPHTNMIYTRLHFRYVHFLLPVKSLGRRL